MSGLLLPIAPKLTGVAAGSLSLVRVLAAATHLKYGELHFGRAGSVRRLGPLIEKAHRGKDSHRVTAAFQKFIRHVLETGHVE